MVTEEEKQSTSGVKVYFRYTDPNGKRVKSAKDVERQLKDEGTLETFVRDQTKEKPVQLAGITMFVVSMHSTMEIT